MLNTAGFHPLLEQAMIGKDGVTLKALQNVVAVLNNLESVFRRNAEELVQLVRATDFLNEKAEKAISESREAIENLSLGMSDVQQSVTAMLTSVEDVKRSIDENTGQLGTLQRALSDFPAMVKELKKMLSALDSRLREPVLVKVDFPAPAAAAEGELTSGWSSLLVDVVSRTYNGNIDQVRIRKET